MGRGIGSGGTMGWRRKGGGKEEERRRRGRAGGKKSRYNNTNKTKTMSKVAW
jgi:hypothetical protein